MPETLDILQIQSLIQSAGEEILKIYSQSEQSWDVHTKQDDSPLTRADLASHKVLSQGLKDLTNIPVISEEAVSNSVVSGSRFWLVDPLDGTKEFINRKDEFAINVALIENTKAVLGFIYAPVFKKMYWAKLGEGAFLGNQNIKNNSTRTDLIAAASRFHMNSETQDFMSKNKISNYLEVGASLKFCQMAEGKIDIYPRMNGSSEWDTAAGQILIEEAGCRMVEYPSLKDFRYNNKNFRNPYFVAFREGVQFI